MKEVSGHTLFLLRIHLHDKGRIEDECCYLDDMGQIFDVREKTDRMIRGNP